MCVVGQKRSRESRRKSGVSRVITWTSCGKNDHEKEDNVTKVRKWTKLVKKRERERERESVTTNVTTVSKSTPLVKHAYVSQDERRDNLKTGVVGQKRSRENRQKTRQVRKWMSWGKKITRNRKLESGRRWSKTTTIVMTNVTTVSKSTSLVKNAHISHDECCENWKTGVVGQNRSRERT